MTAAFLQSELTNLISDSKRKHADVKAAAEKSLAELKFISVTSETQLAGDLIRKTSFVDPFLLACKSQNVKLASNGAACLQRLVASTAIPRSRLPDLLQAFEEAVSLALEVQLKILQTLPFLLQLYAADLHGETLSRTLSVCADLSGNKLPMVSSTASATFQQLLTTVFTKATTRAGDRSQSSQQSASPQDSEDAVAIFIDLCALLSGGELDFVRLEKLPPSLIMETVESLLSTYGTFILADSDALKACAESLVPGLATLIESSASFSVVARAVRMTFILASQHLSQIRDPMADLLMVILKIVDRGGSHKWKRILSLEFFRGFCSDFDALRRSFAAYDMLEGKIDFVSNLMASLVRVASEDPSLIGLGRQSTIPTNATVESNGDVARAVDNPAAAGSVAQAEPSSTGLSSLGSTIQTPCLDQYDRSAPPEVPETYIFTLVLGAIAAFADGLSKFIMPLSVPNRKSSMLVGEEQEDVDDAQPKRKGSLRNTTGSNKYQQLINPLTRKDLGWLSNVEECAKLVESCWPAILATCSTFLNAALDSYFYHMLIRTVQKLTQVSGVLELNTPRDALLTTLAKVSVPANVSALMNTFYGANSAIRSDVGRQNGEESSILSPIASTSRQSIDLSSQTLNVRNLLCLRALLNLGIALGPTLSTSAWTILWQPLEQVEALTLINPIMKAAQNGGSSGGLEGSSTNTLVSEISAVDTARRRMIESTSAYSDSAFQIICKSLFGMIQDVISSRHSLDDDTASATGEAMRPKTLSHKSTRSVSGSWAKAATLEIEVQFVLKFIGRLASVNLHRFKQETLGVVSWSLVVGTLASLQSNHRLQSHLRLQCANIIDAIAVESCTSPSEEETIDGDDSADDGRIKSAVQEYSISALHRQIEDVQYHASSLQKFTDIEIQAVLLMLQALHNIVSSCGDDLQNRWKKVFAILEAVTSHYVLHLADTEVSVSQTEVMAKLYSGTFKIVHLISSDFLTSLDDESLAELLRLFAIFGSQRTDLNMSLTTIALYWNVSSLVNDDANLLHFTESPRPLKLENMSSRNDRDSTLWQLTILGLRDHCKDGRSDSRNAAVRMLAKIVETSLPQMPSRTLNSYCSLVSLPLIDHCSEQTSVADNSWDDTALKILQDFVDTIQSNSALFLEDTSFQITWSRLARSTDGLLYVRDVRVFATVFNALTDVVRSLCQSTASAVFIADRDMLKAAWNLWLLHDPTKLNLDGQTQDAFASYARFLVTMATWNSNTLFTFEQVSQHMKDAVDRLVYNVVHEAYTVDVTKVSIEQEQALQILDILKLVLVDDQRIHIVQLLSLARNSIKRLTDISGKEQSSKLARGTRRPTGVAFSTACTKKVRSLLQSPNSSDLSSNHYPFHAILETCTELIRTKYGTLPTNEKNLLWQEATLLATESMALFEAKLTNLVDLDEVQRVSSAINPLLLAILEVPHLENKIPESRPPAKTILAEEAFDISQLSAVHAAAQKIMLSKPKLVPRSSQKQYILSLFNHSLVARPWYNDLSPDLTNGPLKDLNKIRPGSIRAPNLMIRQNMYPEALKCLLSLVARADAESSTTTIDSNNTSESSILSTLAAPYILLRFAHTLKTFMADQPLRYLQHPHHTLQHELQIVFRAFLDLRVCDRSFEPVIAQLGLNTNLLHHDGKTHLRVMTGLVTRFEKLWRGLPRLKRGLAWQDYEDGRAVEQCLGEWREALDGKTTLKFE